MQAFFLPARLGGASAGKRNDDAISRRRSGGVLVARISRMEQRQRARDQKWGLEGNEAGDVWEW